MSSEASSGLTSKGPNFLNQPKAVWATAFAAVVGFMSIGLVDPILTSISKGLSATPTQVSLLFTSYFFVTSVMMIFTGFISSRIGGGKTLLLGAFFIIVFSALSGMSSSVAELVGFRAGWGFGNALFVVTALSVIVGSSRGGTVAAILMYESALGLGISAGPLLGGVSRRAFVALSILWHSGFNDDRFYCHLALAAEAAVACQKDIHIGSY
ncbi:MFS transporter [Hydrogenovibrio sp. JE_KL2]|uniref:MFS transporter n=1 Tax=Hydrogenovibrio sp. JE_KL2 TaxID=2651188 RepID=UPI001C12A80A|nr:MFS transporter [Hydrogenovibrio sp. JE_KL2]